MTKLWISPNAVLTNKIFPNSKNEIKNYRTDLGQWETTVMNKHGFLFYVYEHISSIVSTSNSEKEILVERKPLEI